MTTASKEQYLESIYRLGSERGPVGLSALAEEMGISPVSTNEMIKKLAALELVTYEPYQGVALTPSGRTEALRLLRRHRLWERFLTDVLGLAWDQVHEEACRLEHATSLLVEEHLARFLHDPDACPHGHPMPSADGQVDFEAGLPMTALGAGENAVILRVPEGDTALLRYLGDLGFAPAAAVNVQAVEPFQGPLTVRIGDAQRVLGQEVASRIVVRRLAPPQEAVGD